MASTITCGKTVAAFRTTSGTIMYALFEKRYESNVHPHVPRWSCIGFGNAEQAVTTIFTHGSYCEGGMLRNGSGPVKPENYIAAWLKELAKPVTLQDRTLELYVSESFYATWDAEEWKERREQVAAWLPAEMVERLSDGQRVRLRLHEYAEQLSELVKARLIAPYRVVSSDWVTMQDESLSYAPAAKKVALPELPKILRADQEECLQQQDDGLWQPAGWQYNIIGKYIRESVLPFELQHPGNAKRMITVFRDAIQAADVVSGEWTAIISAEVYSPRHDWLIKPVNALRPTTLGADGLYRLHLTLPADRANNLWALICRLGEYVTLDQGHQPLDGKTHTEKGSHAPGTVYFETAPTVIGKHQWRCLVLEHHIYGPVTEYQFRPAGSSAGWNGYREWPTWDGNGTHNGLPPSLAEKVYNPWQDQIKQALEGRVVEPPQMSLF